MLKSEPGAKRQRDRCEAKAKAPAVPSAMAAEVGLPHLQLLLSMSSDPMISDLQAPKVLDLELREFEVQDRDHEDNGTDKPQPVLDSLDRVESTEADHGDDEGD
jgi:hypothetical protein